MAGDVTPNKAPDGVYVAERSRFNLVAAYPALRNMPFVAFLIGNTISALGNSFNVLALSLILYQITGNVSAIAYMWVARVASRLLIQPVAGAYVDRWNKKRILLVTQLLNAAVALGFVVVARDTLWLIYILTFLLQSIEGFFSPALGASLPLIVSQDELLSANALRSIFSKISAFAGPALAGALYAWLGPRPLFLFNSASFLIAFVAIIPLHISPVTRARVTEPLLTSIRAGVKFSARHPLVLAILLLSMVNSLVWRVMEIVLVPTAYTVLRIGPQGLGALYSVMTVGGFLGAAVAPYLRQRLASTRWLIAIYTTLALPLALLAIYPVPVMGYGVMLLIGIILDLIGVFTNTALQNQAPGEMLGRIFSLLNVALALGAIPALIAVEPVLGQLGVQGTIGCAAGLILVAGLLIAIGTANRRKMA
jgi:MFS family permease